MLTISQLTKDDIIIVHQLAKSIWPDAFKDILEPAQIEYMLDWMYDVNTLTEQVQTGHLYYMITLDGVPKGFVGLEPNFPDVGTLRMHKLYVESNTHGKGLGKALLEKTIEIGKELDVATINLNVNRFNAAVDFYKSQGFQIVKEENIDIGRGYLMEDYVMVKEI
ncbi:MAG: GNAT family N-acetyltransferase [Crocinitomicaceae bacterium]|nr:GNAT family N-acetyltransferase [Crocinitomicaceae bacterium]